MNNLKINRQKISPFKRLALCAFATLSACASSPESQLYLMKSANGPVISQGSSQVSVQVGPIVMPEYLKREEIVYRSNEHDININEYDRWAESLERNMTSVITSNLATHLATDRAFDYYANFSTKPDFTVKMNVTEFGRVNRDAVSLSVSWELVNKTSRQNDLYSENIIKPIKPSGNVKDNGNVGNVIDAMNEALNELSLTIANKIIAQGRQS